MKKVCRVCGSKDLERDEIYAGSLYCCRDCGNLTEIKHAAVSSRYEPGMASSKKEDYFSFSENDDGTELSVLVKNFAF